MEMANKHYILTCGYDTEGSQLMLVDSFDSIEEIENRIREDLKDWNDISGEEEIGFEEWNKQYQVFIKHSY